MNALKSIETVANSVATQFGLGPVLKAEPLKIDSADVLHIAVESKSYVAKRVEDERGLRLYSEVERTLNERGVLQAKLASTLCGRLVSKEGYAVYEYLQGETPADLSKAQMLDVIERMVAYHRALCDVEVPGFLREQFNSWARANSLDYLTNSFLEDLESHQLQAADFEILERAITLLQQSIPELTALPNQLIHGDIGPGNILFTGTGEIVFIDFSPYCENEIYGLCHFFYWQCLVYNGNRLNRNGIKKGIQRYQEVHAIELPALEYLNELMVRVGLFRVAGPFLASGEGFVKSARFVNRMKSLTAILDEADLLR